MNSSSKLGLCLMAVAAVVTGCSSSKVLIPPRIDLAEYGIVGLIQFSAGQDAELGQMATQDFVASLQAAQPGVPVLELGDEGALLAAIRGDKIDPATVQAIGKEYKVDAIVFGQLTANDVSPHFSVNTIGKSVNAGAELEGTLVARIYDTASGATIWTNVAEARESVANVELSMSGIAGGGDGKQRAQGRLVQSLVQSVTYDFWPRWQ